MKKLMEKLKKHYIIIIIAASFVIFGGGLYFLFNKLDIIHHGGRYHAENVIDCSFLSPYERDILSHHQVVGEDNKVHRAGLWRLNSNTQGSTAAYCAQYGMNLKKNTYYCRMELEDDNNYGFDAKHLRAVLTNTFPYLSVNQVKESTKKYLNSKGIDSSWVGELDAQEMIAGTQAAIWYYTKGVSVAKINQVVNYSSTLPKTIPSKYKFSNDYSKSLVKDKCPNSDCSPYVDGGEGVKLRVESFRDYLISLAGLDKKSVSATEALTVIDKNVTYEDGIYTYVIEFGVKNKKVTLKSSDITFYEDSKLTKKIDSKSESKGKNVVFTVKRKNTDPIYAMAKGTSTMIVPYFYYSKEGQYQSMINVAVKNISDQKTMKFDTNIGSVSISKKRATGSDELPGAKLVLKDKSGKVIEEWTSTKEPKVIHNLALGEYTLTEDSAPENCVKSSEEVTIIIKDNEIVSTEMRNKCSDSLTISKKELNGTDELPGATLVLKDSAGNVIEQWVSEKKPKTIKGLEPGKYTLTEVKPPEYCLLSEESIEIIITNAGKTFGKEMLNTCPDKFLISKRLITGGNELPGAKMQVLNSEGKVVDEWVSTSEPHMFGGLPMGEYTLVEASAPDGCKLSKEQIKFTVTEEGTTKELEMLNACVPATGLSVKAIYYICGGVFVLFGVAMIIFNKKKSILTK